MRATKQEAQQAPAEGPQWTEEWVPRDSVHLMGDLQVRRKLNPGAVKRYREMHAAGQVAPPPLVARVKEPTGPVLYLVDGWHRWEAGALQTVGGYGGGEVLVSVACMTLAEARWEAARANLAHGVPLKPGELRQVLRAFIKAGKHRKGRGEVMSYRELAVQIGKPHTTVYRWVREDFPSLARSMGDTEGGNAKAGSASRQGAESDTSAHHREAMRLLKQLSVHAAGTCPQRRHEVLLGVALLAELVTTLGTDPEPLKEDY